MDRTEEDPPKRGRTKTAKRQLNSHFLPRPLQQGSGPGYGERAPGAKNYRFDCNFQFSFFTIPPKTEKLSHAIDCNIVGEAKLPLNFDFSFHC